MTAEGGAGLQCWQAKADHPPLLQPSKEIGSPSGETQTEAERPVHQRRSDPGQLQTAEAGVRSLRNAVSLVSQRENCGKNENRGNHPVDDQQQRK